MSFDERELKGWVEVSDISLSYEDVYDLIIINRGSYVIDLGLELSEFNEGDILLVKLNQNTYKSFTLSTRQKTYIKVKEKIINQDDGCIIQIINNSDDVLLIKTIRGGIFVDNVLQILNIFNINPKSFDLTLNEAFDGTEVTQVYETNNPSKVIPTRLVQSSLTDDPNTKVVLVDSNSVADYLKAKTDYTLRVIRGNNDVVTTIFHYDNFNPITNANVTAYGYRIIDVSFNYPVQNLNTTVTHINPGTGLPVTELLNFYLLYYGLDTDASETSNKDWLGFINIGAPSGNSVELSADLKTMTIQFYERSMPIGNHKFIVNYSKNQTTPNQAIKDYAIPERVVPIIEKQLQVVGATTITRPVNVEVVSRKEIIVTFNNPVSLIPTELPISVVGENIVVTGNSRADADYDKIRYNINALPVGDIELVVGSITDAYGYATESATFNVKVVAQPPVLLSVIQDPTALLTTELLLKFSANLDVISAQTLVNYTLTDSLGAKEVLQSATLVDPKTVRLVYNMLSAGIYELHVQDVKDDLGLAMIPYTGDINIDDYTVPAVVEIIATRNDNAMIIKFNDNMNVVPLGEHSALNPMNFKVKNIVLPVGTITAPLHGNKWIRFTVPNPTPGILPFQVADQVNIGYSMVKDVRYVINASGNIYPICEPSSITKLVDPISIAELTATIEINDEKSFLFKYVGDNEFISVSKDDFEFRLNGTLQDIQSVTLVDSKTLLFSFVNEIFNSSTSKADILLKTKNGTMLSRDIFAKPIVSNVSFNGVFKNMLNAKLKAISLMSSSQTPATATVALRFTNTIKMTSKNDFMAKLNNTTVLPIATATIVPTNPDTIELVILLNNPLTIADIMTVSVARDEAVLETIDVNDNKIDLFANVLVEKFTMDKIEWITDVPNKITNDKLSVVFKNKINPRSINASWNGLTPIDIPVGDLIIDPVATAATAEIAEIYINSIPANIYGKFRVFTPLGQPLVPAVVSNANIATITLINENTLVFKFNNENITASTDDVIYALYDPKPYISDAANRLYVNLDYKPTTRPVLQP